MLRRVRPAVRPGGRVGRGDIGGCAIDARGAALPDGGAEAGAASDAVLLGAVGGPKWDDPRRHGAARAGAARRCASGLGRVRQPAPGDALPRAARDRAAQRRTSCAASISWSSASSPGASTSASPASSAAGRAGREAVDTWSTTEGEIARLMRVAFELARQAAPQGHVGRQGERPVDVAPVARGRRTRSQREYPDVTYEDVLVDAMAMHLLRRPRDFDVIATENLFGDILTDEASMLAGSMGFCPRRRWERRATPRPTARPVRADPRQRARHRRPGQGESARRRSCRWR